MRKSVWLGGAVLAGVAVWSLVRWVSPDEPISQTNIAALAKANAGALINEKLAVSRKVLSNENLPPEGTRSLFDHIAAENNGVPYPFPKLVEALQKMSPDGSAPIAVMLPHGRSLLKGLADDAHPRVLLAADFQVPNSAASLGVNTRGQLFIGFVENAHEIEVISYNEAAGRYEFQLVQDYRETGARKLVYAPRQVCMTCHQGGAPIFPQRPWNETNAQPETQQAIAQARKAAGLDPNHYLGLPTAVPLGNPERFDELTDVGNFFAATQKLWLDGCGNDSMSVQCRRDMFKLALRYKAAPGDFKEEGPLVEQLRKAQMAALGNTVISVPESDLVNRNPVAEQAGIKGWIRKVSMPSIKLGDGAKNNEDLDAFDKLPKLPVNLDPLTKRSPKREISAQQIDGVYGVASLMTESDIDTLMQAAHGDLATLEKAVDRLPDTLFGVHQFERVKLIQALLAEGGLPAGPKNLQYAYTETKDMSPPIASGAPPLKLSANSPLHPFQTYCFSCHRGNPSKRLNFMGADTEALVLKDVQDKGKIRDALDWTRYEGTDKASMLMPPRDSAQYAALSEELKKNPELLKKMRDTVPNMFGF